MLNDKSGIYSIYFCEIGLGFSPGNEQAIGVEAGMCIHPESIQVEYWIALFVTFLGTV
jgi:hypothetical protein